MILWPGSAQREELYKGRSVGRLRADALETLKDLFFHFELHFPLENILNILYGMLERLKGTTKY